MPKKGFKIALKETEIIFQSDQKNYKSKSYRQAKNMLIEPLNGDFESVQSSCNNILIARKVSPVTLHS